MPVFTRVEFAIKRRNFREIRSALGDIAMTTYARGRLTAISDPLHVAHGARSCFNNDRTSETMAGDQLDDYIDSATKLLALPIEAAWKPAVRANLEVSLRLAQIVDQFALPDDTEPASIFTA